MPLDGQTLQAAYSPYWCAPPLRTDNMTLLTTPSLSVVSAFVQSWCDRGAAEVLEHANGFVMSDSSKKISPR